MENKEVYIALSKFQCNVDNIKKDKKGYNYVYADLPSIVQHIRPLLMSNSLGYSQPVSCENNVLNVKTIVFSTKDGSNIESNFSFDLSKLGTSKQSIMQDIGSVITYIRRYTLTSMLGIVTDEDPDGIIGIPKPNQSNYNKQTYKPTNKEPEKKATKTLLEKIQKSISTFENGKRMVDGKEETLNNEWIDKVIEKIKVEHKDEPTLEKSIQLLESKKTTEQETGEENE